MTIRSSRLGSVTLLLLVASLFRFDRVIVLLLSHDNTERSVRVRKGSNEKSPLVPVLQRRLGCLYPTSNQNSNEQWLCGCHFDDNSIYGDASSPRELERRVLIPSNAMFRSVNRTKLVEGIGLSLEWEHANGFMSVWICHPPSNATTVLPPTGTKRKQGLTRLDARGWTFRVVAQNDQVQMILSVTESHSSSGDDAIADTSFQLSFPEGAPAGLYNITTVLLHVDHQGKQDPPCYQNLTSRAHCKGETLWFDDFVQHVVFENVYYDGSSSTQPHPSSSSSMRPTQPLLPCTSLDQLSPGYFRRTKDGDRLWTPTQCIWNATTTMPQDTTAVSAPPQNQRILLVGDSTFRYLVAAASGIADYRKVLTPHDFRTSLRQGVYDARRWPATTRTLIFSIGLHSTCYNNLQQDLDMLPELLRELVEQWTLSLDDDASHHHHHERRAVVIRSTTATALQRGLDFNAKKCLYYTDTRLQLWNRRLRELATELNVTFWDDYNITASIGPSPGAWAATDGTHYCHPDPDSSFCRQLVSMVRLAMPKKPIEKKNY